MSTGSPKREAAAPPGLTGETEPKPTFFRTVCRWTVVGLLIAGTAVVAHVWYWGSHIDPQTYGASELAAGPVSQLIEWDNGYAAVQASRLTDLPADQLWKVVTDQARFDEFMPYVRSTTVEPLPNGKLLEKQVLDLPQGSYNVELEITLDQKGGVRKASWRQVNGTLDFNEGAWVVEKAGDKSILRYQVAADSKWVPQFVVNYAIRPRLVRLLQAVELRVQELNKNEPQYFARE